MPPNKKKKVLGDHHRKGKKFITPFNKEFPMNEISWTDVIIPELIWIALLFKNNTNSETIKLAKLLTANLEVNGQMSSFTKIDKATKDSLKDDISMSDDLPSFQNSFTVLKKYYPKCPINFLLTEENTNKRREESLVNLKETLEELFDKQSRLSAFTRATFVLIGFESGKLRVFKDSSLADLSAIEDYPDTEKSKRVDASVRSSVNFLISQGLNDDFNWSLYFWNQGLDIEECSIPNNNG